VDAASANDFPIAEDQKPSRHYNVVEGSNSSFNGRMLVEPRNALIQLALFTRPSSFRAAV
jgi:hypothetical protein